MYLLFLDKIRLKYKTTYVNINNASFFIIFSMVNSLKLLWWNFGWMKLLLEPRCQVHFRRSARGYIDEDNDDGQFVDGRRRIKSVRNQFAFPFPASSCKF